MLKNSMYSNKIRFLNNYLKKNQRYVFDFIQKKKKKNEKFLRIFGVAREKISQLYLYALCLFQQRP